jgi:hypothetical protein
LSISWRQNACTTPLSTWGGQNSGSSRYGLALYKLWLLMPALFLKPKHTEN